jgi:multiple sugar transport system substrate-binding protein
MKLKLMGKALYPLSLIIMVSFISGCMHTGVKTDKKEPAAASDKVTLKVMQSLTTPQRTAQLRKLIEHFESENPNISIELISPDYDIADEQILDRLDSKQQVDIVEVRDITVQEYVSHDLLASLENYIGKWSNYNQLSENARLMAREIDNITYFIPSSLFQVQLYYRKDWFDAKALQVPETWQQLFFVGKQLTKPEVEQYGFAFRGGLGAASMLSSIIQDYNGDQVSDSDSMFNTDGSTIFTGSHAAEALELYRKIYVETAHPTSIDWGFKEQVQAFVDGKAAMLIQDSDVIATIQEKLKEGEWATAPLPTGPQGVSHYNVGAAGWGIAKQSDHKDEAWTFISYLSSQDNNRTFTDSTGVISIYHDASDVEKYSTGPYAPYMLMENNPIRFRGVKRPSQYTKYSEYYQMSTTAGRQFLQDSISAKTLLKQFDDFWLKQRDAASGK